MKKKKNIRYGNNRGKPVNKELHLFSSQNQIGYKKEISQNRAALVNDDIDPKVNTGPSKKKLIKYHDSKDKSNSLNKSIDSYDLSGKGNIDTHRSSFQSKKQGKVKRKQIERFHKEEKDMYNAVSENTDKNARLNRHNKDLGDDKILHKVSVKREKYEEKDTVAHSGKSENKIKANKKRYKKILEESRLKEDLNLKARPKKYFKSNFEDEEFTRTKNSKSPASSKSIINEKDDTKGEIPNKPKPKSGDCSKKANDKFRKQEKKILKLQHKKKKLGK